MTDRPHLTWLCALAATAVGCPADSTPSGDDSGSSSSGTDESTSMPPADGSTTAPATSDGSGSGTDATSTTGEAAVCGDDEITGDETCDDGNTDNGDDCYSNCTVPYELAWEMSVDVAGSDDLGFEATIDADDNIIVVGVSGANPADDEMWIQQITADGQVGWSYLASGPNMDYDRFRGIAWLDDQLVLGGMVTTVDGADGLVQRVDPADQSLVWEVTFDGPSDVETDEEIADIAVTSDGSIVVVGNSGVTDESVDAWVALLDGAGALQWEQTYAGAAGLYDIALGVVVADDGTIHVAGLESDTSDTIGFHATYDQAGNQLSVDGLSFPATDIALDPGTGAFALSGYGGGAGVSGCNVRYYDASFAEQWVVGSSQTPAAACFGVSFGPDGDVYAAGQQVVSGQQGNFWVGRIRADGELLWQDSHNDTLDLDDAGIYILTDSTGAAIAIGREQKSGEGQNLFMRKYAQGPTPPPK